MKTVSFKLTVELDDALTALARARNTSRSSVVREALASYAVPARASVTAAVDAVTAGVNGPRDLSSNPKHMARYGK